MNFTNREKELLLGNAPVLSRITLYDNDGSVVQVFNEDDYIVDWEQEDYRYVPDQGFIGQFVERLLDGHLMNIPDNISLENKEVEVELAVVDNLLEEQVYHSYGRFIITKIEKEDVSGSYKFESSDYTKKFNVPIVGTIDYPCTALELLNNICEITGVELDSDGEVVSFCVPKDGLTAGTYYFSVTDDHENTVNYEFDLDTDVRFHDTLMLMIDEEKLILKTIDNDFNIDRKEILYRTVETSSGTLLNENVIGYVDFVNNDFVIEDNQFEENQTCRDVVIAIAKLGYTWARVGVDNKLHLDFVKKSESDVDEHDEIDTDLYYETITTGDTISPINKVLIGMSQVDGENIYSEQTADEVSLDILKGNTSQDTLSGKNLWGIADQTFRHCGIDVTIKDGVITLNGTTNGVGVKQLDAILPTTTATGLYTLSKNEISGTKDESGGTGNFNVRNNDTGSFIFSCALSETNKSYNITSATPIKFGLYLQSGCTYNNYKFRPQLELGGNVTSYEQYCGGIPSPNPNYPQNVNKVTGRNVVKVQGKNLYNINDKTATWNDLTTSEDDWITINSTNTDSSQMYRAFYTNASKILKPNTDYWCILEILGDKTYTGSPSIEFVSNYADNRKAQFNTEFRMDISDSRITDGAILKQKITTRSDLNDCITMTRSIATIPANSSLNLTFRMSIVEEEPDVNTFAYEPYQAQEKEIDLGKNLFDKDNANYVNGWIDTTTMRLNTTNGNRMFYISCKPNTTYTISRSIITSSFRTTTYDSTPFPTVTSSNVDYTVPTVIKNNSGTTLTITTGANAKYLVVHYGKIEDTNLNETLTTIQIEEGSVATSYAPYYNVSKNLFDKNKVNVLDGLYLDQSTQTIKSSSSVKSIYVEIEGGEAYAVSKNISTRFRMATTSVLPARDVSISNYINRDTATTGAFVSNTDSKYLVIFLYNATTDTLTFEQILDGLQIEKCSFATPYEDYSSHIELCKIGDYQDYITKNTGKNLFDINKWYKKNANHTWSGSGTFYIDQFGRLISDTPNKADYYSYLIHMTTTPTEEQVQLTKNYAISVKSLTTYTLTFNTSMRVNCECLIFEYDKNGAYVRHFSTGTTGSEKRKHSWTTASNTQYVYFRFDNESYNTNYVGKLYISNIQLEEGNQGTEYEPYGSGEWYKYYACSKTRLLSRYVGSIGGLDSTQGYVRLYIDNKKDWANETNIHQFVYCNQLEVLSLGGSADNSNKIGMSNTATLREIRIRLNTGELNLQDTKDYLDNNNVTLYYANNAPYTQKITYQPLIDQLNTINDNAHTYEGKTYITSTGVEINAPMDITITNLDQVETSYTNNTDYEVIGHEYEESAIQIFDNPLTYTEELRRIAINGSEKLYGLTYTPMSIETIGHPWLAGDDFVKLTNLQSDDTFSYPFDRKIKYNGALTTDLSSEAKDAVSQKYENKDNIINRMTHTEITVDKANKQIESITQEVSDTTDKITKVTQDVSGISTQIESINKSVDDNTKDIATIQETIEGLSVEKSVTGGTNLIKNSVGYFGNDFWMVTDDTEGNVKTQNDMDVKNNSISANALLLQNETIYQKITEIKNGSYYISFRYKRLLSTATCKLIINGKEFTLTSATWKDEGAEIPVTSNNIQISLISNKNDSCLITDLMVSNGTAKVSWTQNANETYTDGVKIGKGITITATGSDTELSATASSIDIVNTRNRESTSTFDKYGIKTNSLESKGTIRVADKLIISRVGDQMWISTL